MNIGDTSNSSSIIFLIKSPGHTHINRSVYPSGLLPSRLRNKHSSTLCFSLLSQAKPFLPGGVGGFAYAPPPPWALLPSSLQADAFPSFRFTKLLPPTRPNKPWLIPSGFPCTISITSEFLNQCQEQSRYWINIHSMSKYNNNKINSNS